MNSAFNCKTVKYEIKSLPKLKKPKLKKPELKKPKSKEILAFDFDGVFHNKMHPDENIETDHRSPDQDFLFNNFIKNSNSLKPFLIDSTLEKIKNALTQGNKVYIISANSGRLKEPIYTLLTNLGIKIPKKNIIMKERQKSLKLGEIEATEFTDDSMVNIKNIHRAKKNLPHLQKLIWVWPEKKRFYEIDLQKKLSIFKKDWAKKIRTGQHIEGVKIIT